LNQKKHPLADNLFERLKQEGYLFRKARKEDAKAVLKLLHQMFTKPPHGFKEEKALRTIKEFGNNDCVFHLVVEDRSGQIVASVVGYLIDYARFGRRLLIEDLVVDENHRRKGIGTAILSYMRDFAIRRKCSGLVLHTGKNNMLAQSFYKRNQMEENVMFKLDLPVKQ
jgi:ribosomal protein S18 acetylase RimI-like enzyme